MDAGRALRPVPKHPCELTSRLGPPAGTLELSLGRVCGTPWGFQRGHESPEAAVGSQAVHWRFWVLVILSRLLNSDSVGSYLLCDFGQIFSYVYLFQALL